MKRRTRTSIKQIHKIKKTNKKTSKYIVSFFLILALLFSGFLPAAHAAAHSVTFTTTDDFAAGTTLSNINNTNNKIILGSDSGFVSIITGYEHGLGIKSDGTLWAWGYNDYGELGLGDYDYRGTPTQVGADTDWASLGVAAYGSFAIKTDGTLWAWGDSSEGQLGLSTDESYYTEPTQVGTDTGWEKVASSYYASVGLKTDGTVWTWGSNDYSGLGRGPVESTDTPTQVGTDTDWTDIYSGDTSVLAIKTDGTLWGWGYNGAYNLGLDDTENRDTPTQIGTDTDWAKLGTGMPYYTDSSAAIKTDGTLWMWGSNSSGELGLGDTENRSLPVQVGTDTDWASVSMYSQTLATKTDGTLWATGYNENNELGLENNTNRNEFVQIGTDTDWKSAGAGYHFSAAIKNNGSLYDWGSASLSNAAAYDPQLPGEVITGGNWSAVAAGKYHTIAIRSDGTLWGWGYNGSAQLGVGDDTNRDTPTQIGTDTDWVSIATGSENYFSDTDHVLAIKSDGTLWGWGRNSYGELGLGDESFRLVPTQVGTDTDWVQCSAGGGFSICIKTNGTMWSSGWNTGYTQLGLGDASNRNTFTQIGTDTNWEEVSSNYYSSVAVKTDGTMWSWGSGAFNRLGLGDGSNRNTPTQIGTDTDWASGTAGSSSGFGIKTDGTLWAWGINWYGELGTGNTTDHNAPVQVGTDTDWQNISVSNFTTVASKQDGTLWTWGYNLVGQLGIGSQDEIAHPNPTQIGTDTDWEIAHINGDTSGNDHVMALKNDGRLYGWGYDTFHELGRYEAIVGPQLLLSSSYSDSGTIDFILNAEEPALWSSLSWSSEELPAGTSISFRVRTSNDNVTYSDWSDPFTQDEEGSTGSEASISTLPESQYLEIELTLTTSGDNTATPTLTDFTIDYDLASEMEGGSSHETLSGSIAKFALNLSKNTNDTQEKVKNLITKTLKYGMKDVEVKLLQIYLNTHNFILAKNGKGSPGNETNYFGAKTKAAVMKLQKTHNIVIDGVVGPATRSFIK